ILMSSIALAMGSGRLKNSYSLANLYQILGKSQASINAEHFIKLLIDYCLDKQYYAILNVLE
ncbi:hypothetical protein, partial [Klebsiella aerogenes]|uniref:hypothetical protein n=1 Tax=Klebsiella aerogenes TaxID=548 RepID=UPI001954715A